MSTARYIGAVTEYALHKRLLQRSIRGGWKNRKYVQTHPHHTMQYDDGTANCKRSKYTYYDAGRPSFLCAEATPNPIHDYALTLPSNSPCGNFLRTFVPTRFLPPVEFVFLFLGGRPRPLPTKRQHTYQYHHGHRYHHPHNHRR